MTKHPRRLTTGALLAVFLVTCSLTIDEQQLGGERVPTCSEKEKEKECEVEGVLQCVGLDDASFGCSRRNCIPCNLPKATAFCSEATGECAVSVCHGTWDDCDNVNSNGCEINTANDVDHCGACGEPCPSKPHAEVSCGSTRCYIRVCEVGFKDCNDEFADGCEIDSRTHPDHCGACDMHCDGTCAEGLCEPS